MVDRISTTEDAFIRKWYAPSDQAVVIAGDVDASVVADKLKMISYMTPNAPSSARKEYVWEERDTARYVQLPSSHEGLSTFTAVWNSSRTPKEYMNTVQPVIYENFMSELGMLTEEYVKRSFRENGVPYAEVVSRHRTSVQSAGDEAFMVTVSVDGKDFAKAVGLVSQEIGRIDAGRTDVRDLVRMKRVVMDGLKAQVLVPSVGNSEYVDRCVAAFLYNGSLATLKTKADFLAGRVLADSTELRLFNSISSALLDPERNLEVSYTHPMQEDSLRAIVKENWSSAKEFTRKTYSSDDILPFEFYDGPKLKVVEKTDHMSKGLEWTFSNGFKVVYRRMPTGRRLYYTLALNGGFSSIPDLVKGEGGYVSDYFLLSRICGMPADEFIAVLASEGMSLDVHTALNATMISGSVDDDKMDFMMNSLLSALYDRRIDENAVKYYESCEPLRNALRKGTSAEMVAKVNEIMCPDYDHVSYRMLDRLSPDLAKKADRFYQNILQKTNDGVLIILGDVDPAVLKKMLLKYAGEFEVTDIAFRKPLVRYQPASGWSTYTVEGDRNSVDMALSLPFTLTADNLMAAEVAAMVLKKNLSDAIADTGMYLTLSHECRIYPNERMNIHISLNEVSENGFSTGRITSGFRFFASAMFSPTVLPVQVRQFRFSRSFLVSSFITALTPPASFRSSI
jgi:predicted Zn-dependent peptidase